MTDNEAMKTILVRTRPALHEDEDEAGWCEAEAENFGLGLKVTLVLTSLPVMR